MSASWHGQVYDSSAMDRSPGATKRLPSRRCRAHATIMMPNGSPNRAARTLPVYGVFIDASTHLRCPEAHERIPVAQRRQRTIAQRLLRSPSMPRSTHAGDAPFICLRGVIGAKRARRISSRNVSAFELRATKRLRRRGVRSSGAAQGTHSSAVSREAVAGDLASHRSTAIARARPPT